MQKEKDIMRVVYYAANHLSKVTSFEKIKTALGVWKGVLPESPQYRFADYEYRDMTAGLDPDSHYSFEHPMFFAFTDTEEQHERYKACLILISRYVQ